MKKEISLFFCTLLLVISIQAKAFSWDCETVLNSGPSSNRIDIAIVGSSYTIVSKYNINVNSVLNYFINFSPYSYYTNFFNIHKVIVLNDSLGCVYKFSSYWIYDDGGARASNAANSAPAWDTILILINNNTKPGGGTDGTVACCPSTMGMTRCFMHEIGGHNVGLLMDEYWGTGSASLILSGANCADPDLGEVNYVSSYTACTKWNYVPGSGCWPGCYGTNLYRSTDQSIMRNTSDAEYAYFNNVSQQQIIKRIYQLVSPIDSIAPENSNIYMQESDTQTFNIVKLQTSSYTISAQWFIDGNPVSEASANNDAFVFFASNTANSSCEIAVVVKDTIPFVYSDPDNLLQETTSWNLKIIPNPPAELAGLVLSTSTIEWTWKDNSNFETGYRLKTSTGGIVASLGDNATSYIETNLEMDVIYGRYCESYNSNGSSVCSSILIAIDTTQPSAVTNLSSTQDTEEGTMKLSWTTPQDDKSTSTFSGHYAVQYSTYIISWELNSAQVLISTANVPLNSNCSYIITELSGGTTYYSRIWASDIALNWSGISNGATAWAQINTPPAPITDISSAIDQINHCVGLTWTSPGDDGWAGTLKQGSKFKIQYSSETVAWNKEDAQISISTQASPLTKQYRLVTGLECGATYYFRIWSCDEISNWSDISNGTTIAFPADLILPGKVTGLTVSLGSLPFKIDLSWVTPGDNGYSDKLPFGSEYGIQYSTEDISSITWSTESIKVIISTGNVEPGTNVSATLTLSQPVRYYFGIWAKDVSNNWSVMSDTASIEVNPFEVCTLDSAGNVGHCPSITLDNSDNYHISYNDITNSALKYINEFNCETIDSGFTIVNPAYSPIALDGNENPHISYYDNTNSALKYAKWTGTNWSTQTIDSDGSVGMYTSIALDGNGNPHISYLGNGDLKYAKWTGTNWSTQTVDSDGSVGVYTSIVLDGNGNSHISYYDSTNSALKYAKWTGTNWSTQTIDSDGSVGQYTSIALDSNGNPCISYYDGTNFDLKYAKWTGTSWSTQTIDSDGFVGQYTSIDLDGDGNPHISYYKWNNPALKYARWTGTSWNTCIIDSSGTVGQYTSIDLDSNGNPHISYYDVTNTALKYARWIGAGNSPVVLKPYFNFSNIYVSSIAYSWNDMSNEIGYRIYGGTNNPFFLVADTVTLPAGSISWTEINLVPNTQHTRYLQAVNAGTFANSAPVSIYTLAEAPTNFKFDFVSGSSITFSWNTLDNPSYTRYEISQSTDKFLLNFSTPITFGNALTGNTTSIAVTVGENNIWFRIRAQNEEGITTSFSTAISTSIEVPPSAITDLLTIPEWQKAVLLWTAPGDDGTTGTIENGKWRIAYSTSSNYQFSINSYKLEITTTCNPLTMQSCVVTGLSEATTYYFKIWARDENPDGWSGISNGATAYITDTSPPSAPPVVRDGTGTFDIYSTYFKTQLSANWDSSSDPESGIVKYLVAIGTAPGTTNITNGWIDNGIASTITVTNLLLNVGVTYYFTVKAQNGFGLQSSPANSDGQVILNTNDVIPPTDIANVRDGTGSIDISSTTLTNQLSANWDISVDTESGVVRYFYAIGTTPGGTDTTGGWLDNGLVSTVTKTGLTLSLGVTYYFTVKAQDGVGLQSNPANSNGQLVIDITLPTTIISVRNGTGTVNISTTTSLTQLSVNWDASSDPESGIAKYLVAIGTAPGVTNVTNGWIDNGPVSTITVTNLSLTIGVTYYFAVVPVNGSGMNGNITISGGQIVVMGSNPPNVFGLLSPPYSAILSTRNVTLDWEEAGDPDINDQVKYNLYYSMDIWVSSRIVTGITGSNYILHNLTEGVTYWWQAEAVDLGNHRTLSSNTSWYFYVKETPPSVIQEPKNNLLTAHAYPNPFKPGRNPGQSKITFTSLTARATIKIYTISGELVRTLEENDGDGRCVWDISSESRDIPSGCYIYCIKNGNEQKKDKLYIIR